VFAVYSFVFIRLTFSFQMVLDGGKLVEYDSPKNLLEQEGSFFQALVDESGDREALYAMAQGGSTSYKLRGTH
jgi:hypothetical protein